MTTVVLLLGLLAGILALAVGVLGLALRRTRRQALAEVAATRVEAAELRARVDALAVAMTPVPAAVSDEFVITELGTTPPDDLPEPTVTRIEGRLFADIVLRESVVKVASFSHGLRRAFAPETRNRIRFEMKREVKRSRKQRKVLIRDVRREAAARQRAAEAGVEGISA
ncbi:hypothetical protein ACLM5J_14270 [Nocardioides sp. Bht2]|uniref:hypothetical protein n=1 Tax=Nocardioides sp. Bht2 TaxID=3392297 RepID=UPI0039B58EA0